MNIYTNPNNLPEPIILLRIQAIDSEATAQTYKTPTRNRVGINSNSITDLQAQELLANPMSAAETNIFETYKLAATTTHEFLVSSGLAGRNLSTVNNNNDRDNLIKVICFLLGIADSNGVILATPPPRKQK